MKKYSAYILLALITFSACKKTKKKEDKNEEEITTTQLTSDQIKVLLDSSIVKVNATWDSLILQDDNKMKDIKRLLDEVSYNAASDEKRLKELYKLYDLASETRYTLDNINDANIDKYDEIQNKLITAANELAESTPNIEGQPLAIELMNDISEADGMVFSKRGDYDMWAKQINTTLTDYTDKVNELGVPYTNQKQLGTFEPEDGH